MIERCPHCGARLAQSMSKAIRARLMKGIASMDDVREAARAVEPTAKDKQIYNALGALVRRGQARRLPGIRYETLEQ